MANELGDYLRQARMSAHMTLKDVGYKAGIDPGDLSKLERGVGGRTGERSRDTLIAIAKAVGGDVELVLTMAGHVPPKNERQRRESERAVERAILQDGTLTSDQKAYLLETVSYVRQATSVPTRRAGGGRA